MMDMKRIVMVCFFLLAIASPSGAAFITYVDSETVTGSLGGTAFTNATLTIRLDSDTSTIIKSGDGAYYASAPGTATFTLAGFGTGTFTENLLAFTIHDFNGADYAGFSTASGKQVFATGSPLFHTYNLQPLAAMVTGSPSAPSSSDSFATSIGSLNITGASGTSSFTTIPLAASVPEPASLAMLGIGLLSAGGWRVCRGRPSGWERRPGWRRWVWQTDAMSDEVTSAGPPASARPPDR